MEFVQQIADFIMFIINTLKDLIASFTGKEVAEEATTEASGR